MSDELDNQGVGEMGLRREGEDVDAHLRRETDEGNGEAEGSGMVRKEGDEGEGPGMVRKEGDDVEAHLRRESDEESGEADGPGIRREGEDDAVEAHVRR
jgi:hypothetical protein